MDELPGHARRFTLADGKSVLVRPIGPADRARLAEGLTRLSPESRYRRFLFHTQRLTDKELCYLTEVDQVDHVAWGAADPDAEGLPGLAVARFVRDQRQPQLAEMAVTVLDAVQRRGLGTLMLALLHHAARQRNIHVLRAVLVPENLFVVRWLRDLGAETRFLREYYCLDLPVRGVRDAWPCTPAAARLQQWLETLETL